MRELVIRDRRIADDARPYVIAELGSNHQGNIKTAFEMIDAAAAAGVSAVKLQKRDNQNLYAPALLAKPYEGEQSFGKTYGQHREALEFGWREHADCIRKASSRRIACFSTCFDEASADVLERLAVPAYKIPSGGLTDTALLSHVARKGKPIILSTGGGTMADIDRAVATILPLNLNLALLHCTAAYPCEFNELNLRVIATLRERYPDLVIGWSCHVHNISTAMAAYALGARIFEVHVTLNRSMKGTDHAFSLEPSTLKKLVKDLNRLQEAMGDGVKRWYESEKAPISKMRRVWTGAGLQVTGALSTSSILTESCATPTDATTGRPSLDSGALLSSMSYTTPAPRS